ncbi:sn-glycerol-3-phosphate transport system permease protein UgpA [Blautia producta]|uniref:sn-glycerol-3-phosphate transport system permease protein UgpA n=1 Tax=Blautia producta TaxID=33035 RepID=A0A4V0Z7F8_9FIRM|nr:sugar ABC transporter permease [Blautia producta]QBE96648.1 sn-glycerol-3-phosphate transport system permease protein UgpA [Blautia producta]
MKSLTNRRREAIAGYCFTAPAMLGFLFFILIPTGAVLILSLFDWDLVGEPLFIGLTNFKQLFTSASFINTLKVTGLYVLINIPPQYILAMFFALFLKRITKGQTALRTLILIPWITTPIAISVVAKWLLNEKMGLINYYFGLLGWGPVNFFSAGNALFTVAAVNIWQYVGFSALLFYIGMQNISEDYYEAAEIDGANGGKKFLYITLPLLKPTILYQMVTGVINSFQVFDTVYGMTRGGPGEATNVFYYAVYMEAFQFLNMGYGAAMCTVLFLILLVITAVQMYMFRDKD